MSDPRYIYLASQSPRRRALLEQIGVAHYVIEPQVDERWDGREDAREHVARLALEKARSGWSRVAAINPRAVIGADTAVVVERDILGKAETASAAHRMLERLSGRGHQVYSGVAMVAPSAGQISGVFAGFCSTMSSALKAVY